MKLYRLKLTRTLANGVTGERTVGYFRTEADCENAIPEAKNNFNIREDCGKFSIQERDFETSRDESLVTEVCEGRCSIDAKVLADVLFESMDKQPGNRGRGKIRQNCQRFGYTKLKYAAHGRNKARCKRQYRVQRSNCGSRRKLPGRYFFHFFLLSFVFLAYASVRMVSNSQYNYTTERICLQGQQPTYSIQ